MHNNLRTSFIGAAYYRMMQSCVLTHIQRMGLTPNQLTIIGLAVAMVVPLGFLIHPAAGLFLLVVSGMADSLDGLTARHQNRTSMFGAFLDSSIDRLSDTFYLMGFWLLLWPHPWRFTATLLMLTALLLTLMISYIKARAETVGATCQEGIMERAVRVLFLIAWALLIVVLPGAVTSLVWMGFIVYVVLTLATVIHRILIVRRQLSVERPLPL